MKLLHLSGLLCTAALASACAHEPSANLQTARALYAEAEQGHAATVAKADLYEAKKALDEAESLKKRKRGSKLEKDLAYVAARKAQYAMTVADLAVARQDEKEAYAQRTEVLESQRDRSRNQLAKTEQELNQKETMLRQAEAEQAALRNRLNDAMASLSEVATLKDEQGKMVITLNGSVLFKTASATLLPTAQRRLMEVAAVLREYDENNTIVVEGHTDARGSKDYNATLSLHRAQSVERFLEGQGVDDDALRAVGRGEAEPVADNDSPEGRANNRRVEIIIDKNTVASR
ncbi:MAG: OmpA family protein [Nannocystaceae bacterium]|nr:OmpA family protein [bacterium]